MRLYDEPQRIGCLARPQLGAQRPGERRRRQLSVHDGDVLHQLSGAGCQLRRHRNIRIGIHRRRDRQGQRRLAVQIHQLDLVGGQGVVVVPGQCDVLGGDALEHHPGGAGDGDIHALDALKIGQLHLKGRFPAGGDGSAVVAHHRDGGGGVRQRRQAQHRKRQHQCQKKGCKLFLLHVDSS